MKRIERLATPLLFIAACATSACNQPCRSDTVFLTLTSVEDLSAADGLRVWLGDNPPSEPTIVNGIRSGMHFELAFDKPYRSLTELDLYAVVLQGDQQLAGGYKRFTLDENCSAIEVVLAAPSAVDVERSMIAATPDTVRADNVAEATISLRARDANGLPVVGATVEYADDAPPGATDDQGFFSYRIRSATVESRDVVALVNGAPLHTTVFFIPISSVVVHDTSFVPHADGVEVVMLDITLLDRLGRPMADQNVDLMVTGTNNIVSIAATTNAEGKTSATLASTSDEKKEISLIGPRDFSPAPALTVTFNPAAPVITQLNARRNSDDSTCWTIDFTIAQLQSLPIAIVIEQYAPQVAYSTIEPVVATPIASSPSGVDYQVMWETSSFSRSKLMTTLRVTAYADASVSARELPVEVDNDPHFSAVGTGPDPIPNTVGSNPVGLAVDDFNHDGKLDVVTANFSPNSLSVLLGVGDGTLAPQVTFSIANAPFAVVTGDFNGDTHRDIAVTRSSADSIAILLGDGTGSFGAPTSFVTGDNPRSMTVADFDGDGIVDLATGNVDADAISVLRGNGDGTFQAPVSFSVGDGPAGLIAADLNADQHLDLVVTNFLSHNLTVLLGDGNGAFVALAATATDSNPRTIATGDIDRDGYVDVAVSTASRLNILWGDGTGAFASARYPIRAENSPYAVAVKDVNADGLLDLVAVNNVSGSFSVGHGNGDRTLQPMVHHAMGASPYSVVVGDFNGDSALDVVSSNVPGNVRVSLNERSKHCLPAGP